MKERGSALIISLIFLLILSLLAVSGMQSSIMQERMASSQRDSFMAMEVAELGLVEAQAVLDGLANIDDFGVTEGFYSQSVAPPISNAALWYPGSTPIQSIQSTSFTIMPDVDLNARYFFEYQGPFVQTQQLPHQASAAPSQLHSARIVVVARGPSGQSQRLIEAYQVFNTNP